MIQEKTGVKILKDIEPMTEKEVKTQTALNQTLRSQKRGNKKISEDLLPTGRSAERLNLAIYLNIRAFDVGIQSR
jgi:transcription elongation factor GreA-like protein